MPELPAWATREIGPLPVWGWGVVGVVGVGAGIMLRRVTDRDTEKATVFAGDAGATSFQPFGGLGAGSLGSAGGGAINVTPVEEITTNVQWRSKALGEALKQGYTASRADRILSDYLRGEPLDTEAQALIDAVVPVVGLPPSPPAVIFGESDAPDPPATDTPPAQDPVVADPFETVVRNAYRDILGREPDAGGLTFWTGELRAGRLDETSLRTQLRNSAEGQRLFGATQAAPNPPAQPRTYTVKKGDTLSGISQEVYGNASQWRRIFDANRNQLSNPNRIFPGQVLTIP